MSEVIKNRKIPIQQVTKQRAVTFHVHCSPPHYECLYKTGTENST